MIREIRARTLEIGLFRRYNFALFDANSFFFFFYCFKYCSFRGRSSIVVSPSVPRSPLFAFSTSLSWPSPSRISFLRSLFISRGGGKGEGEEREEALIISRHGKSTASIFRVCRGVLSRVCTRVHGHAARADDDEDDGVCEMVERPIRR